MYLKINRQLWILCYLILCFNTTVAQEAITFPIIYDGKNYPNNTINVNFSVGAPNKPTVLGNKDTLIDLGRIKPPCLLYVTINDLKLNDSLNKSLFCLVQNLTMYDTDQQETIANSPAKIKEEIICALDSSLQKHRLQPITINDGGWKKIVLDFNVIPKDKSSTEQNNPFKHTKLINIKIRKSYWTRKKKEQRETSLQKQFTLPKLRNYLKAYPEKKDQEKVDDIAWRFFKEQIGGVYQYQYFFPDGEHIPTAKELLEKADAKNEFAAKWKNVQKGIMTPKAFLADYPDSFYQIIAYDFWLKQDSSIIDATAIIREDIVTIQCLNTFEPRIAEAIDEVSLTILDTTHFSKNHSFTLRVNEPKEQTIKIADALGQTLDITIGQPIQVDFHKKAMDKDTLFSLFFKNGFPPYSLTLKNVADSAIVFTQQDIRDSFQLSQQALSSTHPSGGYQIIVNDAFKVNSFTMPESILLPSNNDYPPFLYYCLGILGLSAGGLAFFLIQSKKKKKTAKQVRKIQLGTKSNVPINKQKAKKEKEVKKERKIIIKRKKGAHINSPGFCKNASFQTKINTGPYFPVNMNKLWKQSNVIQLYFHRNCIYEIDRFLKKENIEKYKEELGETPEIGGFLLGNYTYYEQAKSYEVTFEEFVPIASENRSRYELEFSTASIVQELGDAQDSFPNLSLIGWFHTHPGHGLFLSQPDLKLHKGFFTEDYQIAMEIDSLSPKLDTGFFSWKNAHQMNNVADLNNPPEWLSWTAMEKAIAKL